MKRLIVILIILSLSIFVKAQSYSGTSFKASSFMNSPMYKLNNIQIYDTSNLTRSKAFFTKYQYYRLDANYSFISNIITGAHSIRIGTDAGNKESGINKFNTIIGYKAGEENTSGSVNTFIGVTSGWKTTIGTSNTFIGNEAGLYNTTGSYNIYLGRDAGQNIQRSNRFVINSIPKASESDDTTKSLIYGYMDSNPLKQRLTFNAAIYGTTLFKMPANTGNAFTITGPVAEDDYLSFHTGSAGKLILFDETNIGVNVGIGVTPGVYKLKVNGNVNFTGDLTYNFIHAVMIKDSTSYTPSIARYRWKNIRPAMTTIENDGFTIAGDSIKILTAGDYVLNFNISFSSANADSWLFKIFKNNAKLAGASRFLVVTSTGGSNMTRTYFWYLAGLSVNDYITIRMTNLSASRNPTITDEKIYIYKAPE